MKILDGRRLYAPVFIFCLSCFTVACGTSFAPVETIHQSSGEPQPPVGGPREPVPPVNPDPPVQGFSPEDISALTLWIKASVHQGQAYNGHPVGLPATSSFLNLAPWAAGSLISRVSDPAIYSIGEVSNYPSFILCGANSRDCAFPYPTEGTRLRLSSNYRSYALLQGPDRKAPPCEDCSGSFTITALVQRTSMDLNVLLSNAEGGFQGHTGPYLGWPSEKELVFSTDGIYGSNQVRAILPTAPKGLEVVTAVYSRRNGVKLYWQGELRAFDLLKTQGSATPSNIAPTLGYRQAHQNQRLHVFEYLEFNEDLNPKDVCLVHQYLNQTYQLKKSLSCLEKSKF